MKWKPRCGLFSTTLAMQPKARVRPAILKEKDQLRGKRVATVVSGGNVDREAIMRELGGGL